MDQDLAKVARFLEKKITEAKDEVMEKLDDLTEALSEEYDEELETEEDDDGLEVDDNLEDIDYDGDRSIKAEPEPEAPVEKKGFFGGKKKAQAKKEKIK